MELNIKRTTGIDWVVFVCGANWLNSGVLTVLLQFDTISQTGEYGYSIPYIYLFLFAIDIVCAVWGFYAARVNDVISDIVDSPVLCFKHQDTSATFIVGSAWLLSGYASMTMALDLENAEELYGSVHIQCRYLLLFSAWLLFSSFRRNHFMDVLLFLLSFAGLFAWLVAFIDEPRLLYWQYASSLLYIVAGLVALGCACMICHDNARTRKHPVKWYSMVGIASYLGLGGYMVARTFT
ncbi:hypothetical protein SARC_02574 [Sphaeroforma arctica JP610]|uniref:Uncharacterized protein n=1 Tax=Sphaeroforma arctica JP610 TaxID=667725 RepID=A0A0L0G8K4_9EUKA|nr:hypothetical protein SARC_02574 [Sphaeroforma arctica JP610]KNC85239.1 hypothetical protein SARC_02574 [Sphaeroforma arctica JP610]|eukprot:XP_014159141.1 hypothetical protein SARC_02574 [Sphaeroforma arctica JP610]